jgi:hypothetical protein
VDLKGLLVSILGRILSPPDLGPIDLPMAARLIPKARLTIEGACKGFFWAGVLQASIVVGLVAFRLGMAWHAFKTFVGTLGRLILALIRSKLPPNDRERLP